MWKLSFIVLSLITIGNSTTNDHAGTTEISRNFRNYENQRYRSEARGIEYTDEGLDRRDSEDYPRSDSDEFEGEELIGKWRNSGLALEPKWRDGDSLPLVPFGNSPKQKKFPRRDGTNDETRLSETLRTVYEKFARPEEQSSSIRISEEETIEKIPISIRHQPASSDVENDRYSLEDNYDRRYSQYEDSRGRNNAFSLSEKSTKFPTNRPTKLMLGETSKDTKNYDDQTRRAERIKMRELLPYNNERVETSSRSTRYGDTFQAHPNEYELNDEEYQMPRPRKRRPPQNYEFIETRPPKYSISWSTERYTESTGNLDKLSMKTMRKPEITIRPGSYTEKKNVQNRERANDVSMNLNSRRRAENAELKSLLKMQQSEGQSLSELLQRRNLTLNDLLGGKAEILKALKSRDNDSTEIIGLRSKTFQPKKLYDSAKRDDWQSSESRSEKGTNSTLNEIGKVTRIENDVEMDSVGMRENENEDKGEKMDSAESEDGQRSSIENEKISAIVRLTKSIILPSLDILMEKMTHVNGRSDKVEKDSPVVSRNDDDFGKKVESAYKLEDDEIMEFSDFTTKKIETTTIFPRETTSNGYDIKFDDNSGFTLSIENILSTTQQIATILPINETKIADDKVNTVAMVENNSDDDIIRIIDQDYQSDEPSEIANDKSSSKDEIAMNEEELTMSDEPYEKTSEKIDGNSNESEDNLPKNHLIFSTSDKPYELAVSEIEPDARAEIFELFSTGSSAKRLERLLKSRNMSIEELIELRQRGSSKVHLAEILHSRQNINSRNYKQDERIIVESSRDVTTTASMKIVETTTDDLSDIEIDSTPVETREPATIEEQTNISSIGTERMKFDLTTVTNDDNNNQQLLELLRAFDSLPFSIEHEIISTERSVQHVETKITSVVNDNIVEITKERDSQTNNVEIGIVEEIIENISVPNEKLAETNVRTNYSQVPRNNEERKNLSKVRSSIIASGAILGVTIVVFLAIFIVCRIRQKQKYTYRNTFSRAVFQGPATTARKLSNTSSLNTIMVNVVATSTTKRPERRDNREIDENFESKSDIENDSLDANDSWETIPDFMK